MDTVVSLLTKFQRTKWNEKCLENHFFFNSYRLTAEQNKRIDETIAEIKREIQAQAQFETPAIPKKIDLASEHKTVSDSSSSDKSAKSVCIPTSSAKSIKRSHSNEVLQDTIEKKQKTTDGDLEKPVPLASEPNNIALTTPKIPTFKIKLNEINMKKVEKRLKKRQKKEAMVECENKRGVEFKTLSNETKAFEKHQSLQQLFSLKGLSIKVKRCPATSYSSENESSPQVIRDQIRSNFPTIVSVHEGVIENELMDITEIKMEPKETVPEPSSSPLYKWQKVPPKTHLVAHMSYRINNNHLFFKCHLCSFVPTESKNEFLTHLLRTHKYNRWFGGCNICSEELSTVGTLSDELTHMIEVHIKNDPLGTKCEEPSSGDVPMVSIPNYFLTANKTLVVNKRPELLDGYTTMRKLKPWISTIKNIHQKYQQALDDMMKLECLSALFKCMGSDCSFYTCDGAHFQTHLSLHKVHQINDFKNFSCCSYCDFQTVDEVALTQHIIDVHASAKYQCSHCFYRSFSKQIEIHVNMHHRNLKKGFIEFDCSKEETLHAETIWQKCIKNVPSMCCMREFIYFKESNNRYDFFFQSHSLQRKVSQF